MGSLAKAIEPKSDQLNSDDLITGPITVKITKVDINESAEQKVIIHYQGDNGKPYKPCKSMTRVMAEIWGGADNGASFVGQSMTLYRDPKVKWAGVEVGGIRISHMTGIDRDTPVVVTQAKGKRQPMIIKPLKVAEAPADRVLAGFNELVAAIQACHSADDLRDLFGDENTKKRLAYLQEHRPELYEQLSDAIQKASVADPVTTAMAIVAEIDAAQSKAELRAIAAREDYATAKAACSPEVWAAVQAAAAKRLREVEK